MRTKTPDILKTKTISFSFAPALCDYINRRAKELKVTRSAFVSACIAQDVLRPMNSLQAASFGAVANLKTGLDFEAAMQGYAEAIISTATDDDMGSYSTNDLTPINNSLEAAKTIRDFEKQYKEEMQEEQQKNNVSDNKLSDSENKIDIVENNKNTTNDSTAYNMKAIEENDKNNKSISENDNEDESSESEEQESSYKGQMI